MITMAARADRGYAAAAELLTGRFGLSPPLDRRQVYEWSKRRTRNDEGQPFPDGPPFALLAVIDWYEGGRPARAYRWQSKRRLPNGRFGNIQAAPGVDITAGRPAH